MLRDDDQGDMATADAATTRQQGELIMAGTVLLVEGIAYSLRTHRCCRMLAEKPRLSARRDLRRADTDMAPSPIGITDTVRT
jgi:hypothetical protein